MMASLQTLPVELVWHVAQYTRGVAVVMLSLTCHDMYVAFNVPKYAAMRERLTNYMSSYANVYDIVFANTRALKKSPKITCKSDYGAMSISYDVTICTEFGIEMTYHIGVTYDILRDNVRTVVDETITEDVKEHRTRLSTDTTGMHAHKNNRSIIRIIAADIARSLRDSFHD